MDNNSIWAAGKSVNIGCRVVKWDEPGGFDFHPYGKYIKRNSSYEALQREIKQFTIHWSVTYRASHMYTGLKARNLSCNFMIDDDSNPGGCATVYQCLDMKHGGYSQGPGLNALGPGVELAYMPQAWEKNMYSAWAQKKYDVPPHDTVTAPVHGTKLKVYLPTESQMNALYSLIWGFSVLFPDVPLEFPKNAQGAHITTKLDNPEAYTGLCSHYHLRRSKIDTAGLDYEEMERELSIRKRIGF